ncbi:MAG: hypothetical protein Q4Q62_03850 [Thermoplasmata archaeon]|nr:hypothetical protein [Thermoplasmata archaeon]
MEKPRLFLLLTAVGFVVMLAGFAGYVIEPTSACAAVFVAGLAVMAVSYAMLHVANRRTSADIRLIEEDESVNGYVYYMVGEPEENGATITDLTRR